jgi:twitching motility protein PilT
VTTPYASEAFIHQLLGKALAAGGTDVHLKVGQPPGARVRGDLVYFRVEKIRPEDMDAAARVLLAGAGQGVAEVAIAAPREQVFAYHAEGLGRFRASLYRQRGSLALVLRSIPIAIPTFAGLGLPAAVTPMVEAARGLVVVAGGSGQGKSTTLAAMIGHLNASYPRHVITLEDPIEFVHEDQRGSVCQRAVGADTTSFAAGLRAALRQDPDVIAVSDLADPEVLDAALHAVETGHLVLAAVAAPDVARAVTRLFNLARSLPDVHAQLASALGGVIAQRLVPKRDGSGLVLVCEVLSMTAAVRDALRRPGEDLGAALRDLRDLMGKGASPHGMQTFEAHLELLIAQGLAVKGALVPAP